ncbi:Tellurite resistance protein TerB [Salipiger profundus]|uniref:Tellurite resistance protein TerB n=1 Tax=Salipiger profundus TaxID=1229727 RepID=A0A1U7D0W8_9RHOB|nr:Tellurite resistance protein TerB [Salipiger profundus]
MRPALSILVTAAQSDGEFHPEELDAICQFIENELMVGARCERFREQISIDVLDQLTEIVHRMRPQRSSLPGYITRILEFAPDERARFASALEHVIIADGKVDLDEQEILDELAVFATLESETRLRRLAGVS